MRSRVSFSPACACAKGRFLLRFADSDARQIAPIPSNGLSFPRRLWYNTRMKLEKIQPAAMPAEETFTFDGGTVQGASVGKTENCLFVRSSRRYKLFTEGTDELLFLEGSGHFKWARGEMDFTAGDGFRIEAPGEYEVNGKCTFIVRRS